MRRFVLLLLFTARAFAQGLPHLDGVRLVGDDTNDGDFLGYCASIANAPGAQGGPPAGPLVLGGAPGVPPENAAYVFQRTQDTWFQTQRVVPAVGGLFGLSCALSADGLLGVVGAPGRVAPPATGAENGAAHVFRFDSAAEAWLEEAVLRPSDLPSSRYFGQSVAIARAGQGISANHERVLALGGGRAWVLRRADSPDSLWVEEARLEPDIGLGDSFQGLTVIWGSPYHRTAIAHGSDGVWRAVAGGPYSGGSPYRGVAYIWRLDSLSGSWIREARFPGTPGACMGHSVALAEVGGVWLAAGGATQGCFGGGAGFGYVDVWRLAPEGWVLEARLLRQDHITEFGSTLSLDTLPDERFLLVVGNGGRVDASSPPNGAYVFERPAGAGPGAWQFLVKLKTATEASPFGNVESVGVSGTIAVVGNPEDDTAGMDAGSVFVYDLSGVLTPAEPPPAPAGGLALSVAPNPVRGAGWLTLTLPAAAPARLAVFDLLGREVALVHDGALPAGAHRLAWPAGLAPGLYVVRAEAAGRVATRRVVEGPSSD